MGFGVLSSGQKFPDNSDECQAISFLTFCFYKILNKERVLYSFLQIKQYIVIEK